MTRRFLLLLTALTILLASVPAISADAPLSPMRKTPDAPAIGLEDLDGKIHTLEEYRGKVLIVNFWATWCPPCREEMPSMERAWNKVKDKNVVMLAIDVGEDIDTVDSFINDYPVTFPILLDTDSKVARKWPVIGLPSTFIVDTEGRMVYRAIGGREWDEDEIIAPILELAEKAAPTVTTAQSAPASSK